MEFEKWISYMQNSGNQSDIRNLQIAIGNLAQRYRNALSAYILTRKSPCLG